MEETQVPNHERKSVSVSKRLAWGAGSLSIVGAFGIMSLFYERFYSREEGLASEKNIARIEQSLDTRTAQLAADLKAAQLESTRIIERKVDHVLDFLREDRAAASKINDNQNLEIENLKLIVYSGNKTKGAK